jgi:hypothetical protein
MGGVLHGWAKSMRGKINKREKKEMGSLSRRGVGHGVGKDNDEKKER